MKFWKFVRTSQVLQAAFLVALFANITFGGLLEVALPSLAHGPFATGATGYGAIRGSVRATSREPSPPD